MPELTIDEEVLRALQGRAEQMARGQVSDLGQALCDLARELHDEVVQHLIALGYSVDCVQRLLDRGDASQAVERLQRMGGSVTALGGELRSMIGDLRPPALEELGLLRLYRFCSPACRDLFLAQPQQYVAPAA